MLLLILASDDVPMFLTLGRIALWIAVFTAVASAVDYYRRFNHVLDWARDGVAPAAPGAQR